jgi:hypothetical protein
MLVVDRLAKHRNLDHSDDPHLARLDPVDDAVWQDDELAIGRDDSGAELGNHASSVAQLVQ